MCAVAHLQCSATLIFAKYSSPLLGTAVQHRLTAGWCCCRNTYGDLLYTHVCSGPPSGSATLIFAAVHCVLTEHTCCTLKTNLSFMIIFF